MSIRQHPKIEIVAQMVKNLKTMQETQVQSLGWKDLLEKGMATHPSILADPLAKKRLKEIFLASLVVQLGNNLLATQETQVRSLG